MSRLSEILGVKEGQKFLYNFLDFIYKVDGDIVKYKIYPDNWSTLSSSIIYKMIAHPEDIHPIPENEKPQLTEQQITAIKGRIAEGTPWAARDKGKEYIIFYDKKPCLDENGTYHVNHGNSCSCSVRDNLYDFITFENSPVYLPELVGE